MSIVTAPISFVAVLGPTASGKSALGLALARRLGGARGAEIICCDSQQVYVGMDVGTAKPTRDERREIPHHLLDLVRPDEPFHAARWAALARAVLRDVAARGRVPIVVGGTGLYYRALTAGMFEAPPPDAAIRARHRAEAAALGVEALHARLRSVDAAAAAAVGPRDLVRISRALEIWEQTGVPITALRAAASTPSDAFAPRAIVLDPPLAELRRRIEARATEMFDAGFREEVGALRAAGYSPGRGPLQALGYQQVGAWIDGACSRDEALASTIAATVGYARRQRTWFRKEAALARFEAAPAAGELLERLGRGAAELAAS
jgi:tRNA dimethylallyltransferase